MKRIKKIAKSMVPQPAYVMLILLAFGLPFSWVFAQKISIGSGTHLVVGSSSYVRCGSIINQGTIHHGAAGVIEITGNWHNDGTYTTMAGSTIIFSGTSAQTIEGSEVTVFQNMTLNNSAGLVLAHDVKVNGMLDLQNGILTTLTHLLTIGEAGIIANIYFTRYIEGRLGLTFIEPGTKLFPIGTGGNYLPVSLQYTTLTGTSVVIAEQYESGLTGTLPPNTIQTSTDRSWKLTQTGGSNLEYFIALNASGYNISPWAVMLKENEGIITSHDAILVDYTYITNTNPLTSLGNFGLGEKCTNPTDGGTIWPDQGGCDGFDPDFITGTMPTGQAGWPEYKWQWSTTSAEEGFVDVADAYFQDYDPGSLFTTTWFKRLARVFCKPDWTDAAESNVIKMTIEEPAISGTLTKNPDAATVEEGTDVSAFLLAGSGGNGLDELEYRTHDGASWSWWETYTSGTNIPTTGVTTIEIRTRRSADYCSDASYYTVSWQVDPGITLTWTGNLSSNWNTAGNWNPAGIPTANDQVIIPSSPVRFPVIFSGQSADCRNLIINSDASLTAESGASLITTGDIILNGSAIVNLDRTISENQWHYISSPVTQATAGIFMGDYLQFWDEPLAVWHNVQDPATNLTVMKGYGLWGESKSSHTYTFSGKPNTGSQSIGITYTDISGAEYDGANLVGNPYPSSIDWAKVEDYGAVYYWDGSAYLAFPAGSPIPGGGIYGTGSQFIPPMQGFFIVVETNGTFNLTNAVRTHQGAAGFYKATGNVLNNGLVLQASNDKYNDLLLIRLDEASSPNFEQQRDAWKLSANTFGLSQLWSVCDDGKLCIDVRPSPQSIQLGFANDVAGVYSIGLKEIADIFNVFLEDTKTNIFHDLRSEAYQFAWNPETDIESRFKIHLEAVGLGQNKTNNGNIIVYSFGRDIFIKGAKQGKVVIADIMGKILLQDEFDAEDLHIIPTNLPTGIYVVMVRSGNDIKTEKLFIN
jgi:hypothetical protein